jgi:aryl-alcohol dehydrogenase-like predicted oxidoreductase
MERRKIGSLEVSVVGLGCNNFGRRVDADGTRAVIDAALDAGVDFLDTADIYGNGQSEEYLGRALQGRRERVVLATKFGMKMDEQRRGAHPDYVRRAVEDSLRRLQTDRIDLYQSHQDDPETPVEETLATYGELVREGKIRAIGASNFGAARLAESIAISERAGLPRYESLQPLYNLYDRAEFEAELEPLCVKHGIGVIGYYSLAAGFLTGKYRSEQDLGKSVRGSRTVVKYLNDRGLRILAALDEAAAHHKATPAQVALAWLMARPAVAAPIASATTTQQLEELVGATRLRLDRETIECLDRASG